MKKVLIFGAGVFGRKFYEYTKNPNNDYEAVGFLDNDINKAKSVFNGLESRSFLAEDVGMIRGGI